MDHQVHPRKVMFKGQLRAGLYTAMNVTVRCVEWKLRTFELAALTLRM